MQRSGYIQELQKEEHKKRKEDIWFYTIRRTIRVVIRFKRE